MLNMSSISIKNEGEERRGEERERELQNIQFSGGKGMS